MTVDQTIKQRLVGAIVLVAVAVIFLPGILGKKTERKTFASKISSSKIVTESGNSSQQETQSTQNSSSDSQLKQSKSTAGALPTDRLAADPSAKKKVSTKSKPTAVTEALSPHSKTSQSKSAKTALQKESAKTKEGGNTISEKSVTKAKSSQASTKGSDATRVKSSLASIATQDTQSSFRQPSWLIQVGSFSSSANARSLAKKLEGKRMKAFVRPVNLKPDEVLYRVFVGPWFEKRQAESKLAQVTEITRLKPIVVPWQPNFQ